MTSCAFGGAILTSTAVQSIVFILQHTDYAGGNSLVCATTGRGMAMVSTFIRTGSDDRDNGSGVKVTILSVLPRGMNHHATTRTAAHYQVGGRPVVHHTIHIPNDNTTDEDVEGDGNQPEAKTVDWTIYPTAVIHRLHQNFGLFPHSNEVNIPSSGNSGGGHIFIALSSNLPPASGLSTSSAFVTGLFLVLNSHLNLTRSRAYRNAIGEDGADSTVYNLSTYLGNVENGRDYINDSIVLKGTVQGGVGTFGGSEDHAAILMGGTDEMRLLSFCPTRPASIDMESVVNEVISPIYGRVILDSLDTTHQDSVVSLSPDLTFVIAYSGAKAEKAGGADGDTDASIGYNSACELARKAFDAYVAGGESEGIESTQTLADAIRWERKRLDAAETSSQQSIKACMLRRIKDGALAMNETFPQGREQYAKALVQRFKHFYDESECLVPAAAFAISNEKYDLLGPIVDASHRGAVNSLKNQIAETAWLPLWARGMENRLEAKPLSVAKANPLDVKIKTDQPQRIKALAASAFGAGFGGSCWGLVYRHQAKEFAKQWQNAYDERFPATKSSTSLTREFFITDPGPGAFCV